MPHPRRVFIVCRDNRFPSPLTEVLLQRTVKNDPAIAGLGLELRPAGPDAQKGQQASDIAFRHAR